MEKTKLGTASAILGVLGFIQLIADTDKGSLFCFVGAILAGATLLDKEVGHRAAKIGMFFSIAGILVHAVYSDSGSLGTRNTSQVTSGLTEISEVSTEKGVKETESKKKSSKKSEFEKALAKEVGSKVAAKATKILKKKIGFSELEFVGSSGGANYEIYADGYNMMLTVLEGAYRVFIPSTSYVFYEDGKVKLTAEEFLSDMIDNNDKYAYYIMAQDIVTGMLKNPGSANFPSAVTSDDVSMAKRGDIITVQSYVEAKNSFNAKVKEKWIVQFTATDIETYSYELLYAKVGDNSTGTYTELD